MSSESCVFCGIVQDALDARAGVGGPPYIVHMNADSLTLLDHRPVFPGHCLVITRSHVETLDDLPDDLLAPLFSTVQLLARAVVAAMHAEGSFVGINNRVSQSVPHLHVHVVPRRKGDGLRGFFWPRRKYQSEEEMRSVRDAIRSELQRLEGQDRTASPGRRELDGKG